MTVSTEDVERDGVRLRLIRVASSLLADKGTAAVTTRAVAQAAGMQAPAIYRLFGDKDGLLEAVAEHVMDGYVAEKSAHVAATESDPVEDLRAGWTSHVEFGLANPALFRSCTTRAGPLPRHRGGSWRCCGPGCAASPPPVGCG